MMAQHMSLHMPRFLPTAIRRRRCIRVVVLQQMVAIVGIILTVVLHFIPPKV